MSCDPQPADAIDAIERILAAFRGGEEVDSMIAQLAAPWRQQVQAALAAEQALLGPPACAVRPLQTIGPYQLLRPLGRGGQGSIWLAEHTSLKRRVALKLLQDLGPDGGERTERFRRETEVMSRLDHPGICTIFEAGRHGECAWLAMRLVPGTTLADLPPSRDLDRCLEIVEQAARALHVAHEAGVIHRDIKPANLMVTPHGDVVVIDFGLAGDRDAPGTRLTGAGRFGTPAYASPEQVLGGGRELDRRSDVWSLGVVLYELTTGSLPFAGTTLDSLYRAILAARPPDPRRLAPMVSEDLSIVIGKSLARRPQDRYRTALEFADDLRRLRTRHPIHARPASLVHRLTRWIERERWLAVTIACSFFGLLLALLVSVSLLSGTRQALAVARATSALVEAQLLVGTDPGAALELVLQAADDAPRRQVNDALLKILDQVHVMRTFDGGGGGVQGVDVSPDDQRVVLSSRTGGVRIFAVATGTLVRHLDRAPGGGVPVVFTASGDEIVTGGPDGALRRFDVRSGRLAATAEVGSTITCLARRPGSSEFAAGCEDGTVVASDLEHGAIRARLQGLRSAVTALSFTADGGTLAVATHGGRVLLVGATEFVVRQELERPAPGLSAEVLGIAIAADGSRVVAANCDNTTWCWNLEPGAARDFGTVAHDSAVQCVAMAPDGRTVATGSNDRTVRIATTDTLTTRSVERGAKAAVRCLAYSHDGSFLCAGADDGRLRVMRVRPIPELAQHPASRGAFLRAGFSPDGRFLWALEAGGRARLWSAANDEEVLLPACRAAAVRFRDDSRLLAIAGVDGRLRLFDPAAGQLQRLVSLPAGVSYESAELRFDPTGTRLLITTGAGFACLFDVDSGLPLAELRGLPPFHTTGTVSRTAFDATGARFATVDHDDGHDVVHLWQAANGAALATLCGGREHVLSLAFSPTQPTLAVAGTDGKARLFDVGVAGPRMPLPLQLDCGQTLVESVAFDRSGTRVITAASDGVARVFDARTAVCLCRLQGHDDLIYSAWFSPDGARAVTAGWDGVAIVWDLANGERLLTQPAHQRPVLSAEFSPDGSSVITTGIDGRVRRWPTDPLALARRQMVVGDDPLPPLPASR